MSLSSVLTKLIEFDNSFVKIFTDSYFIGIDEAGRGAIAGPVIACAFCWKKDIHEITQSPDYDQLLKLNDSKQLSKKERGKLYKVLLRVGNFGLGYGSVLEIEKVNILNATFLAMKRAYENLLSSLNQVDRNPYVLIDGNKFNPYINCRQLPIIQGDAKSSLIASASIIAKVYRDMLVRKISKSEKYKRFGWRTNVGYGTLFHRTAVIKHGVTPLHRKLFVRKLLQDASSLN